MAPQRTETEALGTVLQARRPRRGRRRWWGRGALLLALALVAFGCAAAGDIDDTENAVILVINSISQSSDPFGDVLTSSGGILPDTVDVELSAHLKTPTAPPGSPSEPVLQDVLIERYEVIFRRTDGGTDVPKGFQRGMSLRVRVTPPGESSLRTSTVEDLVVVPATTKSQPPISFLIDPGFEPSTGFVNIQVEATMRFFGRTLSGDRVSAVGSIGINFANFADEN